MACAKDFIPLDRRTRRATTMLGFLALLAYSGLSAQSSQTPPKAIITAEDVRAAICLETPFTQMARQIAPDGTPWFTREKGPSRVLVLAPHATAQMREGKMKEPDSGTGSLAMSLNRIAGTTVLVTTYMSPSDPNFYDQNAFKDEVARLVRDIHPVLVLDLHGSDPFRPYDVDLGTMHMASLLGHGDWISELQKYLRDEGILNLSMDYFSAEKNATDTRFVAKLGAPCIQLEINETRLLPGKDELYGQRFAQLLQALVRFIKKIDSDSAMTPDARPLSSLVSPPHGGKNDGS